jgi:hypothetical protein
MPTYNIAGKRVTSQRLLSDDEIDEIAKRESGPTMSANPNPPPDDSAALDAKFKPSFLGDTPMGGLDQGPLKAAGNMAEFLSPVAAAPMAPAIAGAAEVGLPAMASLGGRTVAGAALGGAANYGMRKAGVPPEAASIASLVLGLHGMKGGGGAAAEEGEAYMPRLVDTIKRNLGLKSFAGTAENAAGDGLGGAPDFTPASGDPVKSALALRKIAPPNSLPDGVEQSAGDVAGKVARISGLDRANNEAAQIKKLIGDATQKLNTSANPTERELARKTIQKLQGQLATRTIRAAGTVGGPESLIVQP